MRTLERLLAAIGQGSALAALAVVGCSGETKSDTVDAGGSGGSSGSGGTGTGGASQNLEPYPVDALGCSGPDHDGGYFGQCCVAAHCYEPETGAGCEPSDSSTRLPLPNLPPGSGSCVCGVIDGPYAPNPAVVPESPGSCCYLVGRITCEGRPFLVDAVALVAPIVRRSDWV